MSKLGDIHSSFGKQFSIAVANTYVDNILNAQSLPQNTIILSSPYDKNSYNDLGTPSILITDSDGEAILLSKSISIRNGLLYSNDSLSMSIDNKTITTKDNKLYIDLSLFVDNTHGLAFDNNEISIDNSKLQKANNSKYGVVSVDNVTIKSDNGLLYANTNGLDHANAHLKGTVIGDNNTIQTINGIPNVITSNLNKAGITYGVAKTDNESIKSINGTISVKSEFLISDNEVGLLKVDGKGIISNNGVLSINTDNIVKASETTYGVVKINPSQFEIDNNGKLTVKDFDNLTSTVDDITSRVQIATHQVELIEEDIVNL